MTAAVDVSVVMAVYDGVDPRDLRDALDSLTKQTAPPREVLLVEDGELPDRLIEVIAPFVAKLPLQRIALERREGAGPARNAGLERAQSTWVAIADADDISIPTRLEVQHATATRDGLDLLGAAMIEFGAGSSETIRAAPATHEEIVRRLRMNNPVNHPTMFFRADLGRAVGGYRSLPFVEDYDFVARMIAAGARTGNASEPLVRFRLTEQTLRRRAGRGSTAAEIELQRTLRAQGFISPHRAVSNLIVRSTYRLLPVALKRMVNRRLLARPITSRERSLGT